ncbi:LuxR C-terminal-related transcriptional regulator [Gordonia terrae]|uniref:helix-turn-helix transcriptional regulator n=1 Tax=Gordonia terrae TaxID=2055 RepID=UPI003F6BE83D
MNCWPLTGRAEELAAASAGVLGGGIVISGAAGVGKSRLAHEILDAARRTGRRCRYLAATESARSVPLGVFAEYTTGSGEDPLARIGRVLDAVAGGSDDPPLVLIDDAHLLDDQSALVVHQMVLHGTASVVLTVRTGKQAPDTIRTLWKSNGLARLELQPLSRLETVDLLENVLNGVIESESADRLWHYTRGNVLYLRQLVSDELAAGHLFRRFSVWIWDRAPMVSQTLFELVDAGVGRQPDHVVSVVDVLAVAEPLQLETVRAVVGHAAVEQAEAADLITVDTDAVHPVVRLAHPMYGEVRRHRAPALRLRRLRSAVIAALPTPTDGRPLNDVELVRRAVLTVESDTTPDPDVLVDAANAAIRQMDPVTGERLARCAIHNGGGVPAQTVLMNALANGEHLEPALAINHELLAGATTEVERVVFGLIRVGIFLRQNNRAEAGQIRDWQMAAEDCGLTKIYECLLAAVLSLENDFESAAQVAVAGLSGTGELPPAAEFVGRFGLVTACGELGRISLVRDHAQRGHLLARTSPITASARFSFTACHAMTLLFAGLIGEATGLATRFEGEPMDHPLARAYRATFSGLLALSSGELPLARRLLAEASALVDNQLLRSCVDFAMATALAMTGDAANAQAALSRVPADDPARESLTYVVTAAAWTRAAGGLVSEAIDISLDGARAARDLPAPAREVMCLQTAAQFGDTTYADRLVALASRVEGPRVGAAAAHVVALRAADGDGLMAAAKMYESFGDLVAAGDAAAQAAVVCRSGGLRGSAMTATAFSRQLAARTGADTPALRMNQLSVPLTARQREVIALAGQGMTNREIADRLTTSVRTVEGHLFRASRSTGVSGRDALIGLLLHPDERAESSERALPPVRT